MQLKTLLLGATLALGTVCQKTVTVTATPTATGTPPPPGETYVTGYPLCGVAGYTVIPGNYTETIEQQSGSDLIDCLNECIAIFPNCSSIAYNARYTECLFFNMIVSETQLTNDTSSSFVHYDLACAYKLVGSSK